MTIKEQQQQEKRQRLVIKGICNRLISRFSLREVQTWEDVYRMTGYGEEWITQRANKSNSISILELRSYCKQLEDNFEKQLKEKYEPTRQSDTGSKDVIVQPRTNGNVAPISPSEQLRPIPAHFQPSSAIDIPSDESGFNNSNDYGLQPSAKEKAFLFWFQKKSTKELFDKVVLQKKRAVLLIASTGTGKTYIQGALDRRLKDINYEQGRTWGHIPYLAITRNSVVEQTKRVLKDKFSINPVTETEVLNIEKLRTRAGQIWIDEIKTIEDGEEVTLWKWKPLINPAVIYLDECQSVKNEGSTQHKIIVSAANSDLDFTFVFISATPFTRVSEAKAFAIATRKDITDWGFPPGTKLTAATWNTYAAAVSHPSPPDEYNEAAVERLMKDLDDYIVRVKGVRWQFNAINSVEVIDFEPPCIDNDMFNAFKNYDDAWRKYLEKLAKLEQGLTENPALQKAIALGQFLKAAEFSKVYIFAKRLDADARSGYAAFLGCKQKATIIKVVQILIEKYGWRREDISLIWGGGQTQLTERQKLKAQVRANEEVFKEAGISMADMMLEEVEDRELEEFPPEYRLGNQSKDQRQIEIDRFQSGRSKICIYTYKAGGVGLSIHHTDEFTKEKVRRQKNGYAVVEDIPKIPTRPRKGTLGPTWSPIELVQSCGRAPRLTSLSNTIQNFMYYRGTVEEEQAFVITHRLKCLSKVVRQHENWQDLIENHEKAKEIAKARVEEMKKFETDEPQTEINIAPELEEED